MSVSERDFSSFHFGDHPAELAGGLMPHLAAGVEFTLSTTPDPQEYYRLAVALGKNKVLRNNEPVDVWNVSEAAELVEASGVQNSLDRSLWGPDQSTPDSAERVATGGVANWQTRTATLLGKYRGNGGVWLPTGNREMKGPTEAGDEARGLAPNKQIAEFRDKRGRFPKESDYAGNFVVPELQDAGYDRITIRAYDTGDGDDIARRFAEEYPQLFAPGGRVAVARVANAGLQLAWQMRKAARLQNPGFDADPDNPQLFVLTDAYPLAETAEQVTDPGSYQSPFTALRQVALSAMVVAETWREQNG